jgi:hypothetical protein
VIKIINGKEIKIGCGELVFSGQGPGERCGNIFYPDVILCDKCEGKIAAIDDLRLADGKKIREELRNEAVAKSVRTS